ncbi:MAG TPA: PAS domain S-box protein, partial [Polyangiales bacterium]
MTTQHSKPKPRRAAKGLPRTAAERVGRARAGASVRAPRAPTAPKSQAVLTEVLELSRRVPVDLHEDEIVHAYVASFSRLFTRRLFCVRLFSSDDGTLSTVYATGRLRADRRDRVELSEEAAQRHGIDAGAARRTGLRVTRSYTPIFSSGAIGFDIPMMEGQELIGLVSVEYAKGVKPPADDRALLVQLTLLFGSTLKNARSHRRSIYLRDYLGKLIDHANAPIMVMGKRGEVRLANRAFLALLSFQREELLGREWMSFLPEGEQRHLWTIYI